MRVKDKTVGHEVRIRVNIKISTKELVVGLEFRIMLGLGLEQKLLFEVRNVLCSE